MRLTIASNKAIKYALMNFHYAKRKPNISVAYNVYNKKNDWCGVIAYGLGAAPSIGKPYNLAQGEIIELVRVALNGKQDNVSKIIGISLKLLKKDCPTVKLVVSYADKGQNHKGIIYQASNWYYVDESNSTGKEYFYKGRWTHSKTIQDYCKRRKINKNIYQSRKTSGKYKYIYPLVKDMREMCEKIKKSYPKNASKA